MELPKKLYINKHLVRPGMLRPAQYPPDSPEVEYIRKDELLEWAEKQYLNENASLIRRVCYKQLIDKLNSM